MNQKCSVRVSVQRLQPSPENQALIVLILHTTTNTNKHLFFLPFLFLLLKM